RVMLIITLVASKPMQQNVFDTNFNSQHFLNGTTSIERLNEGGNVHMQYNQATHNSIPLFNYSNLFSKQQIGREQLSIVTSASETDAEMIEVTTKKTVKGCEEDWREYDDLMDKFVGLENSLKVARAEREYCEILMKETSKQIITAEEKLNYTTNTWNNCKLFCGSNK
ncbi:hypothetical protein ILUMI_05755, partial [Ignelater luminosus]